MFKNILLAYDGSEHAKKAATTVSQLARQQNPPALVRVVCASDPIPANLGEPNFSKAAAERTMSGEKMLAEAKELLGNGLDIHTELLFGDPAQEIIEVAEVRKCDLIVMGSRGLSGLRGLLLGSHTQKVIAHAHCPVLVVR